MSLYPSTRLLKFLEENPLPWISYNFTTDRLELVVDNHILSTYRRCPQHAMYAFVRGLKKKALTATPGQSLSRQTTRIWFLEFGILLHKVFENYYVEFREGKFDRIEFVMRICKKYWDGMRMDEFSNEKEFISIGGFTGFVEMILQFVIKYSAENEKIRILGTEIGFGKGREVPLSRAEDHIDIDVYLSGRIDILADDGIFISPLDHKSFGTFKRDPLSRFVNDDGPAGYIYACKTILPTIVPTELILKRDCNRILMNLLQKKPEPDLTKRFKRFAIYKTEWQLEQYRQRQIETSLRMIEDLERYVANKPIIHNTDACTMWFFRECPYYDIDRQASKESQELTIKNGFVVLPVWDTENVTNEVEE